MLRLGGEIDAHGMRNAGRVRDAIRCVSRGAMCHVGIAMCTAHATHTVCGAKSGGGAWRRGRENKSKSVYTDLHRYYSMSQPKRTHYTYTHKRIDHTRGLAPASGVRGKGHGKGAGPLEASASNALVLTSRSIPKARRQVGCTRRLTKLQASVPKPLQHCPVVSPLLRASAHTREGRRIGSTAPELWELAAA